ncbi:hypothetical protein [Clostridium sp.]|uniref:hypothetical protein n=1 Tax=Clostridium sp. TaxID=1506 RepID=UPI002A91C39A|nr:hypothetical protein [Clostridium sp.]MDY6011653.1 hypothetical protein [Clostridium sp.]
MFKINLPGNLKVKKIILIALIIACIGVLIKTSIDNKKDKNINISTQTELR